MGTLDWEKRIVCRGFRECWAGCGQSGGAGTVWGFVARGSRGWCALPDATPVRYLFAVISLKRS